MAYKDPFLDDSDGLGVQVDFRPDAADGHNMSFAEQIAASANAEEKEELERIAEQQPELVTNVPALQPPEAPADPAEPPAPATPPEPAAPPEPQLYEYPDGSSVMVEKTNRGWKATLDTGIAGAKKEIFYGKTKDELFSNLAAGKIHATRKIREMNQQHRTAPAPPAAPAVAPAPATAPRELNADELFKFKNLFETNPLDAIDFALKLRTGHNASELKDLAESGRNAARANESEQKAYAETQAFIDANPDYYPDSGNKNYSTILAYMSRTLLKQPYLGVQQTFSDLMQAGLWTSQNLQEAYEMLSGEGLLLEAPSTEPPAPAAAAAATVNTQPATNSRIAGTRTGKRALNANLGIHTADTHAVPPVPNAAGPSVEELENMSDQDISKLFDDVVRANAQHKLPVLPRRT